MLVPVFTLKFNNKIVPRLVTVGNYDGSRPCLTGATTGGKVFIHNPGSNRGASNLSRGRAELGTQGDISLLNINQVIGCVAAGKLDPTSNCDILIVGTQNNLLGYDIKNNRDIFFKEMPDGANSVVIGKLGSFDRPLAVVGGNCSIQGFDIEGNDLYWTVTGDNVCSLALVDFNSDNNMKLVVGSEDFEIRVFQDDSIAAEMTETEAITSLCPIDGCEFAYSLNNGTVGVYSQTTRIWRIKSKNTPMSIFAYDLDGDGVKELITGWSNGKVDARNSRTGEIVFKDTFGSSVAGIVEGDYRQDGNQLLICCSVDGEVKGFMTAGQEVQGNLMDVNINQETIRELNLRKQGGLHQQPVNLTNGLTFEILRPHWCSHDNRSSLPHLLMELKNYEENQNAARGVLPAAQGDIDQQMGVIPANTQITAELHVTRGTQKNPKPGIELVVSTNNDTVIRTVVVFAEGIFDGESHCIHPAANAVSSSIRVTLFPPKDVAVDLYLKAFVGCKNSLQYHVYELTCPLPKFCLYQPLSDNEQVAEPAGYVTFHVNDRVNRVWMWLNQSFLGLRSREAMAEQTINLRFLNLRHGKPFCIKMNASGEVCIRTDDMDLAGDIVQELASFLNISEMSSAADFPDEFARFGEVLDLVQGYQATRQKMSSDMADHSNLIRNLIVRAEDARIMGDMREMRRNYQALFSLNHDLLGSYRVRCTNHQELLDCLKLVNQTIQKAAKLRVGKQKAEVVNACREAVKNNSLGQLLKIMKTGAS